MWCKICCIMVLVHLRNMFSCWARCSISINLIMLFDNVLQVIYNHLNIIYTLPTSSPVTERRVLKFLTMALNFSFYFLQICYLFLVYFLSLMWGGCTFGIVITSYIVDPISLLNFPLLSLQLVFIHYLFLHPSTFDLAVPVFKMRCLQSALGWSYFF